MVSSVIQRDVDGDLIQVPAPEPGHYAKRLSLETAWHAYDACDLVQACDDEVDAVETTGDSYLVHYNPNLQLLSLGGIRHRLPVDTPLGPWYFATFLAELAGCLKALHEHDLPQMVIHPGRIGVLSGRFVLLPTLGGVLQPLSHLDGAPALDWLHFVEPYVLRHRAIDKMMLAAGDVYALGRTVAAIADPSWEPPQGCDALRLAQERVESQVDPFPWQLPESLAPVVPLIRTMVDPSPWLRPTAADLQTQATDLAALWGPRELFARLLTEERMQDAESLVAFLEQAAAQGAVICDKRSVLIMRAELLLRHSPPDCARALTCLDAAESPRFFEPDTQLLMARAYSHYYQLSNYRERCLEAYERAARLSGWPEALVDEWAAVINQWGDTVDPVAATQRIPAVRQTAAIVAFHVRARLARGDRLGAWFHLVGIFPNRAFDQSLYDLAREVAFTMKGHMQDLNWLLIWLSNHREKPEYASPVAAVLEVTGEHAVAARHLEQARRYTPSAGR